MGKIPVFRTPDRQKLERLRQATALQAWVMNTILLISFRYLFSGISERNQWLNIMKQQG